MGPRDLSLLCFRELGREAQPPKHCNPACYANTEESIDEATSIVYETESSGRVELH
jgi:hypothetical protein